MIQQGQRMPAQHELKLAIAEGGHFCAEDFGGAGIADDRFCADGRQPAGQRLALPGESQHDHALAKQGIGFVSAVEVCHGAEV